MNEYMIVDYNEYSAPDFKTSLRVVGLKELLAEVQRANDDPQYCFAVYEIREQSFLDFSLPREE